MDPLFYLMLASGFGLGSSLGSFFAACRDRKKRGLTCDNPRRSQCPGCLATLSWWENVPLLSYVMLKGRCRTCGWAIPRWYFFYELICGVVGGVGGLGLWIFLR